MVKRNIVLPIIVLSIVLLTLETSMAEEDYKLGFDVFPKEGIAPHYVRVVVFVDIDKDISVKVPIKVYLNGQEIKSHDLIAFRGRNTVAWDLLLEKPGTYEISVNDLPPKKVVVYETNDKLRPPKFEVEFDVTPTKGEAPLYVLIIVFVRNLGDLPGEFPLEVYVNGKLEHKANILVYPGVQTNHGWRLLLEKPGTYEISVNNLSSKKVVVYESGSGMVESLETPKPLQPTPTLTPVMMKTTTPTPNLANYFTPTPVRTLTPLPTPVYIPTQVGANTVGNQEPIPWFEAVVVVAIAFAYSILRKN